MIVIQAILLLHLFQTKLISELFKILIKLQVFMISKQQINQLIWGLEIKDQVILVVEV